MAMLTIRKTLVRIKQFYELCFAGDFAIMLASEKTGRGLKPDLL
jgi:hypothetical protein